MPTGWRIRPIKTTHAAGLQIPGGVCRVLLALNVHKKRNTCARAEYIMPRYELSIYRDVQSSKS